MSSQFSPDLQAIAYQRCLYHRLTRRFGARLECIFMPGGAPQVHEVWFEELKQKVPTGKK